MFARFEWFHLYYLSSKKQQIISDYSVKIRRSFEISMECFYVQLR